MATNKSEGDRRASQEAQKVICRACDVDCTAHYHRCSRDTRTEATWCERCFAELPCGRGEHGRKCEVCIWPALTP